MKADLHIHSTVSDGSFTREQIVAHAIKKGLDVIAFTDHDTVAHINDLPLSGQIKVLGGIEVSAFDKELNCKVHILGYNIRKPEILEKAVAPTLIARHENCMKQIEILQKNGFQIDLTKIRRADNTYIYKQHIMDYLVKTRQVEDMFGEFYQRIFKHGGICDFDIEYSDPRDMVEAICDAGGLAVLAHSGQQQNFILIPGLVKCGLKGLEYNHPANSAKDKEIIKKYAKEYDLFLTGGSDFHGAFENKSADIGDYLSEESGITEILGSME